ncbi:uncharacterized protein LOC125000403 [Mugil cephalus]|uniref:uncharacterized protein LOC125000403 n=1 Tax=Mugil cephalus TaxID=48193 RepID=UPI001FB76358|nr:uncharacterized protein LOC125000403 [Mugil cephalus]
MYSGRVTLSHDKNISTLRISDLRESDSAQYKFSFTTNQPGGKYTGSPGVNLTVTDLQVKVSRNDHGVELSCQSRCLIEKNPSYIWYKSGNQMTGGGFSRFEDNNYDNSYSCAFTRYEDHHSPLICLPGSKYCNRVNYIKRRICSPKGSSVNISCIYATNKNPESKLWFSRDRSHQWKNPSQPEDLSKDSQYSGRVQVLETTGGRSTLRISDLRERDSSEYHFKFTTQGFEWRSVLPGITVTVTALQVEVTRIISVHQFDTEAELKCLSSCSPADHVSYVWFKNKQEISKQQLSTVAVNFSPGDIVSCALRGHEDHQSPSLSSKASFCISDSFC